MGLLFFLSSAFLCSSKIELCCLTYPEWEFVLFQNEVDIRVPLNRLSRMMWTTALHIYQWHFYKCPKKLCAYKVIIYRKSTSVSSSSVYIDFNVNRWYSFLIYDVDELFSVGKWRFCLQKKNSYSKQWLDKIVMRWPSFHFVIEFRANTKGTRQCLVF